MNKASEEVRIQKAREACRIYYRKNKDKLKAKRADYLKEYYKKNKSKIIKAAINRNKTHKDQLSEYHKQYRNKNREKKKKYAREYELRNRESLNRKAREYKSNRQKTDVIFRITLMLRNRVAQAIRKEFKNTSTKELLGCSIDFFKSYIAEKFQDGMSWDNHGKDTWHIDHIIPCAKFDLSDPEQQKQCFHYTNMQPMWAKENLSKSCKIMYPIQTQLPIAAEHFNHRTETNKLATALKRLGK